MTLDNQLDTMKVLGLFVAIVLLITRACDAARPILWDADDDRSEIDPPSAAAEAGNLLAGDELQRHHALLRSQRELNPMPPRTDDVSRQSLPHSSRHQTDVISTKPLEYAQMQVASYGLAPNSNELVPMLVERHYVASTTSKLANTKTLLEEEDAIEQPPEYPLSEKRSQQSSAVAEFKHKSERAFLPLSESERRRRAAQQQHSAFRYINDTDRTNMALMHAAAAQSSYAYQTLPFMLMFALFNQNRSSPNSAVMAQDSMSSSGDGTDTSGLYGTSVLPNMPESMMGRNNQQEQGIVSIDPSLYGGDNTQAMKHLLQKLLDRQDRRIRPNLGGEPVKVGITMFITTISKINEGEMDYTVDFYFRQYWKDHRLAFNASFLRDKYVSVGAEFLSKIWVPDTFFPNEKRSYFHEATTSNKFIRISPDGSVYNSVRMTVTASCPMDLTYFPMDRQRCKIEVESYGYGVNDILYYWNPQDPKASAEMDDIELPQFIVWPKGACHNNTVYIVLASGKYSRLVCEFLFVRSMGYYLIQIYIPAGLIVIISWVSFWLSRDSTPARVQLGVIVVLSMTTLMSGTTASLPKVSYVKSIDVYLGICFVMVFASLLEYAAVGYTAKRMKMRRAREKLREHMTMGARFEPRANSFAATVRPRFASVAGATNDEGELQPPPFESVAKLDHERRTSSGGFLSPPTTVNERLTRPLVDDPTKRANSVVQFDRRLSRAPPPFYTPDPQQRQRRGFNPSEIDKYSRIVFPLAFVAFNIVYWFAYLHVANMVDKEMLYSYSDLVNTNKDD